MSGVHTYFFYMVFIFVAFSNVAHANCDYYRGHVDVEGKVGSDRDIAETALFLPVSCSRSRMIYSDIRLKGDNVQGREGNLGLGYRNMYAQGIAGLYAYFDRRKSGQTDKYYNQVTIGTEWLAKNWDVRANGYLPLNDEKTVSLAPSVEPYLSGTGIFIEEQDRLLREESLHGGDFEVGVKMPEIPLWVHGGLFSFSGDSSASLDGYRGRVSYEVTENVTLSVEKQYDDERGSQHWLGARLTMPFGKKQQNYQRRTALEKRMTIFPVRDVDIVTDFDVLDVGPERNLIVNNKNTGAPQRVIYVDNSHTGLEDGSKENPYTSLAAAEAAMADNDIIYVYAGNGTSTGMDQSLLIDHDDVQVIGAGANFVFDTSTMSFNSTNAITKNVIIPASAHPLVTNTNAGINSGDGIRITGADVTVSGLDVSGAQRYGVRAAASAVDMGTLTLSNMNIANNTNIGFYATAVSGGNFDAITIKNSTFDGNASRNVSIDTNATIDTISILNTTSKGSSRGISMRAYGGGVIDTINVSKSTISNSSNEGIWVESYVSGGAGTINTVNLNQLTVYGSSSYGVRIQSVTAGSVIGDVMLTNSDIYNNDRGIYVLTSGGSMGDVTVDNSIIRDNDVYGVYARVDGSNMNSFSLQHSTLTGNGSYGIYLDQNFGGTMAASLNGYNQIYGNGPTYSRDVRLDLDNGTVDARNNWWGQAGGPVMTSGSEQIVSEAACPDCGTANTNNALDTAP